MTANRRTPTPTSHPGGNIPTGTYAIDVDEEIKSLNDRSTTFLSVTGTNTLTATGTPTLDAYVAGQRFAWIQPNTSTGAVTLNIDGLGAKDVRTRDNAALAAGDLAASRFIEAVYDGTQFRIPGIFGSAINLIGINFTGNPSFDYWQAGVTFALTSGAVTFIADLWKGSRNATGSTVSRQTGFAGSTYCARVQRDSGNSSTNAIAIRRQIESVRARLLAGKQVTISADIRVGANHAGSISANITTGTGVDEPVNVSGSFATGNVSSGNLGSNNNTGLTSTVVRVVWNAYTVPTTATELCFSIFYTPSGTAGAAEYFEITNVKLEVGASPTTFLPDAPAAVLLECLRHYQKSFLLATTPAQNAGAGTGEHRFPATIASNVTKRLGTVHLQTPMRAAPTVTLYNPAAANAQVRNLTQSVDGSSSAAGNISEKSFEVTCTGNASDAVGDDLAFHWTADSRL